MSGFSGKSLCSATITQSAGVPSMAHSRSAIWLHTIGCRSVSDCAAPLCSRLGMLPATGKGNKKAEAGEEITPSKVSPPFEQRQESSQRIAQIQQHLAAQKLRGPFRPMIGASAFGFSGAIVLAEMTSRPRDG